MDKTEIHAQLEQLQNVFSGDIYLDDTTRIMYATDASAYREIPLAVTRPKNAEDIRLLIDFARNNKTSLIPRAAGTSLAGQVVGNGIVVDISKYMNRILELNKEEKWVRVEPGVNLDELNLYLKPHGLFFGPETATSSRCLMGGMVGNNSCGAHSIVYRTTREHTLEVKGFLSDGSEVNFKALTKTEFDEKCRGDSLEGKVYRQIKKILSNPENRKEIREQYPHPDIYRRNNGYAIDILLETEVFSDTDTPFNFCKLIAGSEGTLMFMTEIKLNLVPLPPKEQALVCVHCETLEEAFKGNLIALRHKPGAVELMDDIIIAQTENQLAQKKNRFFIKGNPKAILIAEFAGETPEEIEAVTTAMIADMKAAGYGYHYPVITGDDINKVWNLRKAGLGLLGNIPGDAKPAPVIEDTVVRPEDLPDYMVEITAMLERYGKSCVHYAHIGSGELHLRPVLNLKDSADVKLFHDILEDTAKIVKKYRGSLSGEHGDGRLRGEFIPYMVGEKNYQLLKDIKKTWDPHNIFNPGKIVDTPVMNECLRYVPDQPTREIETIFDFSKDRGIMRAVEKCNGSGDCRKSFLLGGTLCPSFMATRDEINLTRARANVLREFLTNSPKKNPFDHKEIYAVMDLCLSCKACKSECPSSVDMAKLKAEFLQHYYDANGIPLRSLAVAYLPFIQALGSRFPWLMNFFMKNRMTSSIMKYILKFNQKRNFPLLQKKPLRRWAKNYVQDLNNIPKKGKVYLFTDEFTNFLDTGIGIDAIVLLNKLGYEVVLPEHSISARTFLSKGLVRSAQKIARKNIMMLKDLITADTPLIGVEPSAILTFRDEYPDLVNGELKEAVQRIAENSFLFDEYFMREVEKGNISADQFTDRKQHIMLHGHCQQKAVASTATTLKMLSFPKNYSAEEIPSGCCGMAGAFGFEKEHYDVSMKIGEMVLFPAVRAAAPDTIIAAPGTSCRQQIRDGTGRKALHPIEVMAAALTV